MLTHRLRLVGAALLLAALGVLLWSRPVPAAPQPQDLPTNPPNGPTANAFVPGSVLVRFKTAISSANKASTLAALDATVQKTLPLAGISVLRVPEGNELAVVEFLRKLDTVESADPDYIVHADVIPNDPVYAGYQWDMPLIHAPQAWDRQQGAGPLVGVIDTGLDYGHPDLVGHYATGTGLVYDPVSQTCGNASSAQDDEGHGTHVSGIIAAPGNNSTGIAGVSWTSTILPFKALNYNGNGCTSDWITGLSWLADHGVKVINMSLGGGSPSATAQAAVNDIWNRGIVIFAAAGNDYDNRYNYPASYDNVVSVASVNYNSGHSSFSNFNDRVDIAAPGGDVIANSTDQRNFVFSTYWRGSGEGAYLGEAGTSQATPHVTGAAALLLSRYPNLSRDQIVATLLNTTTDLGAPGRDNQFGNGLLNIDAALDSLEASQATSTNTPIPPTATNTPIPATPTSGPGCIFSDVCPADYWFAPVQHLMQLGAISGYNNNTFRPNNNTTRGQLTKILVIAEGWNITTTGGPHFDDVPANNTFYTFIETAFAHNVISGYADGTFRWQNNVTRGQLAKIIVNAEGWTLANPATPTFVDVARTNTFYKEIETAYAHGIISGYALPNNRKEFRWANNATRAQISKIVNSAITAP